MSNYKPRIESNNLDLTSILSTINELPEAGASMETCTVNISSVFGFYSVNYTAVVDGKPTPMVLTPSNDLTGYDYTLYDSLRFSELSIPDVLCGALVDCFESMGSSGATHIINLTGNYSLEENRLSTFGDYVLGASFTAGDIVSLTITTGRPQ